MRLTFIFSSHYTRKQRSFKCFWSRNKERKTERKKQRKKEGKKVFVVYFIGDLCVEDADEARSGSWDGAGGRLCCQHFGAYEKKKCEIQKKNEEQSVCGRHNRNVSFLSRGRTLNFTYFPLCSGSSVCFLCALEKVVCQVFQPVHRRLAVLTLQINY